MTDTKISNVEKLSANAAIAYCLRFKDASMAHWIGAICFLFSLFMDGAYAIIFTVLSISFMGISVVHNLRDIRKPNVKFSGCRRQSAGMTGWGPRGSKGLSRFGSRYARRAQALVSIAAIATVLVLLSLALHYPNCSEPMSGALLRRLPQQHLAIPVYVTDLHRFLLFVLAPNTGQYY